MDTTSIGFVLVMMTSLLTTMLAVAPLAILLITDSTGRDAMDTIYGRERGRA